MARDQLIYDFTAETFSMTLAVVHEKLILLLNHVIFHEFLLI